MSEIRQHCTSKHCFLQVSLSNTVAYPTRNTKVFVLQISLSITSAWMALDNNGLILESFFHLTFLSQLSQIVFL
ncbi:hypothetical protein RhiirA4_489591 [Rhizophagus irregularis]|uniref:Uncharacterized protein n=1 Tax=Rhizophagus irregularis TaxID=588596 RepID=A0A2I1HUW8_9GLOM|nr:hypothetical protein RhiirA4_489591 [Rhizophagus irregularis]